MASSQMILPVGPLVLSTRSLSTTTTTVLAPPLPLRGSLSLAGSSTVGARFHLPLGIIYFVVTLVASSFPQGVCSSLQGKIWCKKDRRERARSARLSSKGLICS